jgi:hypothetical protein
MWPPYITGVALRLQGNQERAIEALECAYWLARAQARLGNDASGRWAKERAIALIASSALPADRKRARSLLDSL